MNKNFKDTYRETLYKNEISAISDNPILALVNGTPDDRVREALRMSGWPEADIEDLINQTKIGKE